MVGQLIQSYGKLVVRESALVLSDLQALFGETHQPLPESSPPWGCFWNEAPCDRGRNVGQQGVEGPGVVAEDQDRSS